jgi:hypothetical protein
MIFFNLYCVLNGNFNILLKLYTLFNASFIKRDILSKFLVMKWEIRATCIACIEIPRLKKRVNTLVHILFEYILIYC